ncbi:hypothetical protein H6F86_07800 [Phormidium sp. FACHB-592]|uniref:Uncharacterized protein n=1 Tax=Stenomitos frigidus AS-A4 TaxID=2933935 RepID=A0ABV0KHG3_9CYAN|nr:MULTISPECIES: hypothetical protein [Cyanophyceae]MBD2037362.1 hypothetical protein [Leptolyngbya sp. FACHB-321]MBD2073790.1 hypothetical protein [Phormidium sp. FACHB-592]
MRQLMFIGLVGAIALTTASCTSESDVATAPSPVVSAPAVQKPATSQPFGTKATPLVAQKPPAGDTIPGLIQSTNGNERAKQVQASIDGRKGKDPFAGLPPKLQQPTVVNRQNVPTVNRLPTPPQSATRRPTTTAFNPRTPLPPRGTTGSPQGTAGSPRGTAASPQGTANTPTISTLPPLPSATLANGVQVSGVVVVNGAPQAIVKAPNEETSRHVRVGQRISNGQVLVKRIEMNAGSDPIVIFEENGVEVARAVGATVQAANPV